MVCKKKNLSWLFGVDRKIRPSGSLFSITRKSLVMQNSDPRTDVSIMKDSYNDRCRKVQQFKVPDTFRKAKSSVMEHKIKLKGNITSVCAHTANAA